MKYHLYILFADSYHFTNIYTIHKIYIMSIFIEDSNLFVIHMMHYIVIMNITNICTKALNSVLQIQ